MGLVGGVFTSLFHGRDLVLIPPELFRTGQVVFDVVYTPLETKLLADARAHGITEMMVPRTVVVTSAVPLLATGKIDYVAAQELAARQLGTPEGAASAAG